MKRKRISLLAAIASISMIITSCGNNEESLATTTNTSLVESSTTTSASINSTATSSVAGQTTTSSAPMVTTTSGTVASTTSATPLFALDASKVKAAVEALATGFTAHGDYHVIYDDSSLNVNGVLLTKHTLDKASVYDVDKDTNEVYYDQVYYNEGGKVAVKSLTFENELETQVTQSDFEEWDNPFIGLDENDFVIVNSNTFKAKDENIAKSIASLITGWNEDIEEFSVTVDDNGNVISMYIKTALDEVMDESYYSVYTLDVTDIGTTVINLAEPMEETDESLALLDALENMPFEYVINHVDVEEGYDDIQYNVYATNRYTYNDYDEAGLVEFNGVVYEYSLVDGKAVVGSPTNSQSVCDVECMFTMFAPEIFVYDNGVYTCVKSAATDVATFFAVGEDELKLYQYATGVRIELKDDCLLYVEIDYDLYGTTGTAKLTFNEFDEEPISLEDIEEPDILAGLYGTYVCSASVNGEINQFKIEISERELIVDGREAIYEYDAQDEIYYFSILKVDAFTYAALYEFAPGVLVVYIALDDDSELMYFVYKDALELPAFDYNIIGTYEESDNHVSIYQDHIVLNDKALTYISTITDEDGDMYLLHDELGVLYLTYGVELENGGYAFVVEFYEDGKSKDEYIVFYDKTANEELPVTQAEVTKFLGEYSCDDCTVIVSAKDVIFSSDSFYGKFMIVQSTAESITCKNGSLNLVLTVQDENADEIVIYGDIIASYKRLLRSSFENPFSGLVEEYIGTYVNEEKEYEVQITQTSVIITTANGVNSYTITEIDEYEGITCASDTEEYYLSKGYDNEDELYLMNSDFSLMIVIVKIDDGTSNGQTPVEEKELIDDFVGTFSNTRSTVVITKTTVTVTEGSEAPVIYDITNVDEYDGITAALDNDEIYVNFGSSTDVICLVMGENYDILFRMTEVSR